MARNVAALEVRLAEFGNDLWTLMPQMYKDRSKESTDPMSLAWVNAVTSVAETYQAVKALSSLTAAKAAALPTPDSCPCVNARDKLSDDEFLACGGAS
jgi:hypothetical protein